jgi:hypothetical protein
MIRGRAVDYTLSAEDMAHIDVLLQKTTLRHLGRVHAPLEHPPGPQRRIGLYIHLPTLFAIHSSEMKRHIYHTVQHAELSWPGYGHMVRLEERAMRYLDGSVQVNFMIDSL